MKNSFIVWNFALKCKIVFQTSRTQSALWVSADKEAVCWCYERMLRKCTTESPTQQTNIGGLPRFQPGIPGLGTPDPDPNSVPNVTGWGIGNGIGFGFGSGTCQRESIHYSLECSALPEMKGTSSSTSTSTKSIQFTQRNFSNSSCDKKTRNRQSGTHKENILEFDLKWYLSDEWFPLSLCMLLLVFF